jgi:hypothetical protein
MTEGTGVAMLDDLLSDLSDQTISVSSFADLHYHLDRMSQERQTHLSTLFLDLQSFYEGRLTHFHERAQEEIRRRFYAQGTFYKDRYKFLRTVGNKSYSSGGGDTFLAKVTVGKKRVEKPLAETSMVEILSILSDMDAIDC